jgi:arylsulfatase A-like enzyme
MSKVKSPLVRASPSFPALWQLRLFDLQTFDLSTRSGVLTECHSAAPVTAAADRAPNFIIIFTDDQGYQDLGCFGSPDIRTPHVDGMAREGMKFTSFYGQPVCGPSRAALMTGCQPLRVAQKNNGADIHPRMHSNEITIAEVLKKKGYATGCFGKWDLAGHSQTKYTPELLPPHQGFDTFFGTPSSNDRNVNLFRGTELIEKNADMGTLTRRYTDEALKFIEANKDRPFFVYIPHTMPHTILAVSKDFKGRSAGGFYGDVIEEIDHNTGRVLTLVKNLGLDDQTYVIFTSDNGPWHLRGDHGGHATPLRSAKTSCWEGGQRVPCVMRAPGRIPAGTTCDAVTATIDLLPTLASLAGAPTPDDRVIDGKNIADLMHGKAETLERRFYYYQHTCLRAVRFGEWKLMLPHTEPVKGSIATRWQAHIAPADAIRIEEPHLYNLDDDIGETTNLAAKHPEVVKMLTKMAESARNDIGDHDRLGKNARFFDKAPKRIR